MLANPGAVGLLIIAPVLYGGFYPQPFLTQILRDVPIAVVDNDSNGFSRDIVDALDASGSIKVAVRADTLDGARRALDRGKVFAGALIGWGVPEEDAKYYESEVSAGRYLVTVDAGDRSDDAYGVFTRHGGYDRAGAPKM